MEISVQLLQQRIRSTMERLMPLLGMANAPMVKFFTENLWKTHIPAEVQQEIQTTADIQSAIDIYWTHLHDDSKQSTNDQFKHFRGFLSSMRQYHLESLQDVWITPDQLKHIFDAQRSNPLPIKGFMSTKKNHEVYVSADVIANMCAATKYQKTLGVIDAGDGKGYLSTRLSLEYGIKVLGVDYNPTNTRGAQLRSEKLERFWDGMKSIAEKVANDEPIEKQTRRKRREQRKARIQQSADREPTVSNENYKNVTHFITPQTDFIELFRKQFNSSAAEVPGLCLSGLHTCGNLAPSCLRIFSENKQIIGVCNIGCCYHLLNEQFSKFVYRAYRRERSPESARRNVCEPNEELTETRYGFPMSQYLIERQIKLGRNARMLACQSVDRVVDRNELPSDHLFFRSLLEVLIKRKRPELLDIIEVGRMKQCHTFVEYVRNATKRNPVLKFDDISDDELQQLHEEFCVEKRFLDIYHLMRVSLAAIVENVILLDRFLYLKECAGSNDIAYLVRFFDPVISPRCYGLVAMKRFTHH